MGEVTNAYVIVSNSSQDMITNLCTTLSASDEGRPHPDKMKCIPRLPGNSQVALKLTADTTYRENTYLKVALSADGGIAVMSEEARCSVLTSAAEKALKAILNLVRPTK